MDNSFVRQTSAEKLECATGVPEIPEEITAGIIFRKLI
jgi:hypothetical protein